MKEDFKWNHSSATNIAETIRKEWARLGQLPPDEDPRVQANRQRLWALTGKPPEVVNDRR